MEEIIDQLAFEKQLWQRGIELIAGVDEVGRGCLFGDVVSAAVVLPTGLVLEGINDSKKLSEKNVNSCMIKLLSMPLLTLLHVFQRISWIL